MKPEVWGPGAWLFLHSITLEYPHDPTEQDKRWIKQFFESVGYVLPCEKCKINFQQHLMRYPLTENVLTSKSNLVRWLINIHNSVNQTIGVPVMDYQSSLKHLLSAYEDNDKCLMYIIIFCIIFIILTVGIIYNYVW